MKVHLNLYMVDPFPKPKRRDTLLLKMEPLNCAIQVRFHEAFADYW